LLRKILEEEGVEGWKSKIKEETKIESDLNQGETSFRRSNKLRTLTQQ